ncbi:MAG TPA: hypothetical protein PLL66_00935 [Bacteroidales bacterium]|nr:hypothetical protein [Bacteroidales bacterium]
MQDISKNSIIVRTEHDLVYSKLEKFCNKKNITINRVFSEEGIRDSVANIFVIDHQSHKYKNKIYFDMFNSLPYNREKILAVFVIGKKIKGKSGILKKTFFVDTKMIEETLIVRIDELLNKNNNDREEIIIRKLSRMVEIIKAEENGRKLDRKEFCKKHQICKRTLERDIKIVKAVKNEIRNLNVNGIDVKAGTAVKAKKLFRIIYFYLHILLFDEVISEQFCKYFDISQRTLSRDIFYLNTALEDRQIEGDRGVFR